jgi:hypothetical protein
MTLPEGTAPDPAPAAPTTASPAEARQVQEAPREPLHFVVILLLVADVVFGLGLAVFAEKVLAFRPMAIMGCGLAALGLGILAYFVFFGGGRKTSRRW